MKGASMKRKYLWMVLIGWVVLAAGCAGSGQYRATAPGVNPNPECAS
jgi:hypothetical protein